METELVEPHPHIVERRHELGFDYGKFDDVVVGEAVLFDANKTVGHTPDTTGMMERVAFLATGLDTFPDT